VCGGNTSRSRNLEIGRPPPKRKKDQSEYSAHTDTKQTAISNTDLTCFRASRDVLHPNRPNVSKDELREKLADLYKSNKDQVSVFGFRTQYGGGKSTGFALVYDSSEALKKFEPHYRLVRIGAATKIEKASRQQRMFRQSPSARTGTNLHNYRQATEEPLQEVPWYRQGQGPQEEQGLSASFSRTNQHGLIRLCGWFGSGVSRLGSDMLKSGAVGRVWGWLIFLSANIRLKPKMMPVD
jgi:ribosomal protein S24E